MNLIRISLKKKYTSRILNSRSNLRLWPTTTTSWSIGSYVLRTTSRWTCPPLVGTRASLVRFQFRTYAGTTSTSGHPVTSSSPTRPCPGEDRPPYHNHRDTRRSQHSRQLHRQHDTWRRVFRSSQGVTLGSLHDFQEYPREERHRQHRAVGPRCHVSAEVR